MPYALTPVLLGLVAYTYVGYPVAVTALARLRPAEEARASTFPRVSVIVAAL